MHQAANGKVRHHQPVEFLPHQIGGLAAQDDFGAAQMSLELVKRVGDILPINITPPK
jgi:hypothetical protein